MQYLIWCHERKKWWKKGEVGYTGYRSEAGRYPREEAESICNASSGRLSETQPPEETMIPDFWEGR